jgi:hypothetical protein
MDQEHTTKRFMQVILFCLIFLIFTGCIPRTPTLEGSLKADDPSKKIKMVIAVNDSLADAIGAELSARGFPVIESARLGAVLSEKSLQLSGIKSADDEKLLEAGKFLKADSLIFVETKRSPDGTINAAIINIVGVRNGAVTGSFNYQNGRVRENQKDTAKRIADAINSSFR